MSGPDGRVAIPGAAASRARTAERQRAGAGARAGGPRLRAHAPAGNVTNAQRYVRARVSGARLAAARSRGGHDLHVPLPESVSACFSPGSQPSRHCPATGTAPSFGARRARRTFLEMDRTFQGDCVVSGATIHGRVTRCFSSSSSPPHPRTPAVALGDCGGGGDAGGDVIQASGQQLRGHVGPACQAVIPVPLPSPVRKG